jgi:CHAT domain-containing protein/Tfp pilus assembly protein PilF
MSRNAWGALLLIVAAGQCLLLARHAPPRRAAGAGIIVMGIDAGSAAQQAGVQVGDRLLSYGGRPLSSPYLLMALEENGGAGGRVSVRLQRRSKMLAMALPPGAAGIIARPELPPALLTLFTQGVEAYVRHEDAIALARFLAGARAALENGNRMAAVWLYEWIAETHRRQRHLKVARAAHMTAWELGRESGDVAAQSMFLDAMASLSGTLNDFAAADRWWRLALQIDQRAGYEMWAARDLMGLGLNAYFRGRLAEARDLFEQSMTIRARRAPDSIAVARSVHNLGVVAYDRGDLKEAYEDQTRALQIALRLAPDSWFVANYSLYRGMVEHAMGEPAAAQRDAERALRILEQSFPEAREIVQCLNLLGRIARDGGDRRRARIYFLGALAVLHRGDAPPLDVAETRNNLGELARDEGKWEEARALLSRARAIDEQIAPDSLTAARSLGDLGSVALAERRFVEARSLFDRAVRIDEEQRRAIPSPEARTFLAAREMRHYRGLLRAQLALGDPAAAFATVERARARSLLDLLAERREASPADVPPALADRQQALDDRRLTAYTQLGQLDPERDRPRCEQLRQTIQELAVEQRRLAAEIRRASPRYAALHYPQPLDPLNARRALDPGTLLLSYLVDEQQTTLFAVSRRGLRLYRVPIRERALRDRVRRFREALSDPSRPNYLSRGRELFRLLVAPAWREVRAAQRVLICPDGPLHELPFAGLTVEEGKRRVPAQRVMAKGKREDARDRSPSIRYGGSRDHHSPLTTHHSPTYLVERVPLHTVVSMSVYDELRRRERERRRQRPVMLLAFGDPVYRGSERDGGEAAVQFAKRGLRLTPLPATRQEVLAIANLYGPRASVRLGSAAVKSAVRSEAGRATILHFACHAMLDDRDPLASALALTPEGDREDGLLRAYEVMQHLRLDADLVVLSACESGLGEETREEGIVGLARAFQYAGARSVLVSLWKIGDRSTTRLMAEFYLQLRAGKSKDEALRQAQLTLRRSRRYSHPFYWAPFVLSGSWR